MMLLNMVGRFGPTGALIAAGLLLIAALRSRWVDELAAPASRLVLFVIALLPAATLRLQPFAQGPSPALDLLA
jgi:hypothetical protein